MSVPICNCFHARRANSGKKNHSVRYPFLMPATCTAKSHVRLKAKHIMSWSISSYLVQFAAEMCVAARSHKNFTTTSDFGGSRSSMLIPSKSLLSVLVVIRSMSLPICNSFHARQANSGKIDFCRGSPLSRPRSTGTPSLSDTKFLSQKTSLCRSPHWRFRISVLHCFDTAPGCDRWTDRRLVDS